MKNIMILDDEKFIRMGLRKFIEESGISFSEIIECRNGQQALEAINQYDFDVIFTDIKMPIMDGLEFIKHLKALNYKTKIIVLSGYDEFEYAVDAFKRGAIDYLLKPVEKETIVNLVKKLDEEIQKENSDKNYFQKEIKQAKDIRKKYDEAMLAISFKEDLSKIVENPGNLKNRGLDVNIQIEKALTYIDNNYHKKINMANVSNYVSMSYSFFSETFKNYVGINFALYLTRLRINKAKEILISSDVIVADVAKMVGYDDEKLFMKKFKQETKLSPTQYRKFVQIIKTE